MLFKSLFGKCKLKWIVGFFIACILALVYLLTSCTFRGARILTYAQYVLTQVPVFDTFLDESRIRNQLWIDRLMYAKDSEMRSTAATMVCKFGYGPSAVKALIATLDHEDLRCTAIFGLGHLGDVSAVEPLISFARNDKNTNIRRTAIDSLGEIGDEAATDTLIEIVQKEKDEELRDRAAWALGEIRSGKAVVTLIATIQNDRSTDVRRSAAWALGQIGDDRAAETLIEAIENNRCGVRGSFSAVRALGKIQGERAIQALIAIVNCGKPEERLDAVEALGKIGDRRAVEVLIGALTDYDSKLQLEAVRALNKIGDERAARIRYVMTYVKEQYMGLVNSAMNAL
jgi:HEAT repeat protein